MGSVSEVTGVPLPDGVREAVVTLPDGWVVLVIADGNPARLAS